MLPIAEVAPMEEEIQDTQNTVIIVDSSDDEPPPHPDRFIDLSRDECDLQDRSIFGIM